MNRFLLLSCLVLVACASRTKPRREYATSVCGDVATEQKSALVDWDGSFPFRSFAGLRVRARPLPQDRRPTGRAIIHVLFVHTEAWDRDDLAQKIDREILLTNRALAVNRTGIEVACAGVERVVGPCGDDMRADLHALARSDDARFPDIHVLRKVRAADVVCLLRNATLGGDRGMAFVLEGDPREFCEHAFMVVRSDRLNLPAMTFAHELGHLLGCGHSTRGPDERHLPSTRRGTEVRFEQPDWPYHTILSDVGAGFLGHFSDPSIVYEGASVTDPRADNAAAIAKHGPAIAAFR